MNITLPFTACIPTLSFQRASFSNILLSRQISFWQSLHSYSFFRHVFSSSLSIFQQIDIMYFSIPYITFFFLVHFHSLLISLLPLEYYCAIPCKPIPPFTHCIPFKYLSQQVILLSHSLHSYSCSPHAFFTGIFLTRL